MEPLHPCSPPECAPLRPLFLVELSLPWRELLLLHKLSIVHSLLLPPEPTPAPLLHSPLKSLLPHAPASKFSLTTKLPLTTEFSLSSELPLVELSLVEVPLMEISLTSKFSVSTELSLIEISLVEVPVTPVVKVASSSFKVPIVPLGLLVDLSPWLLLWPLPVHIKVVSGIHWGFPLLSSHVECSSKPAPKLNSSPHFSLGLVHSILLLLWPSFLMLTRLSLR